MKGLWKGILYALVLAVPAAYLGKLYPIIGGPVFGILLGIICAFIPRGESFNAGINFTGKKILQYSIILLGFEMNLFNVLELCLLPNCRPNPLENSRLYHSIRGD